MTTSNRLGATVGGKLLESEQARALWERFSAYMDVHRNDFAGFAKSEGWAHASVGPYGTGAMLTLGNDAPKAAATGPAKPQGTGGAKGKGRPAPRGPAGGRGGPRGRR